MSGEYAFQHYWSKTTEKVISSKDCTITSALVHQGILPCFPILLIVGITIEALEIYCVAHLRCPHLSIQVFVKTMCDFHGFSIAFLQQSFNNKDDTLGASSEVPTSQLLTSSCYLSCNFVDKFSQDLNTPADDSCKGRWSNMDDIKTKRSWGIYNRTGIFVAIYCHGFCLLIVDMVQSGELAKYPLVVVAKLLDMFGSNLGGRPLAHSLHHTCLVGAFHGHAHRCLCQLISLTMYIKVCARNDN
ncbi:uncharacterized protein HD556DRAFT_1434130 [Suillus plorans]|uniref:Uncharacterized protein n=1 Tax=Suillus plorans TaxID=116603 RepID=A0A9P7DD81_9AGAM|nr:uncharacterized protein HD556DRAFT_1434130 [Suillus plorans]KAG1788084.1 hypothetical protein HD556DRAFT_1434130 [Suillus plorans]